MQGFIFIILHVFHNLFRLKKKVPSDMMQLEPGFNQDLLVYGKQGVEEYIN